MKDTYELVSAYEATPQAFDVARLPFWSQEPRIMKHEVEQDEHGFWHRYVLQGGDWRRGVTQEPLQRRRGVERNLLRWEMRPALLQANDGEDYRLALLPPVKVIVQMQLEKMSGVFRRASELHHYRFESEQLQTASYRHRPRSGEKMNHFLPHIRHVILNVLQADMSQSVPYRTNVLKDDLQTVNGMEVYPAMLEGWLNPEFQNLATLHQLIQETHTALCALYNNRTLPPQRS